MSGNIRIDPRRTKIDGPHGLPRIVVRNRGAAEELPAEKPLRTLLPPKRRHLAIAHSDRGSLDIAAQQTIAAAAILADAETGVIVAVLGELNDDLAQCGADLVAVFPQFSAHKYQPEQELAVLDAMISAYAPTHIFLPDNASGDGDLGRRLIAHLGAAAATHVVEVSSDHVAVPWSGGSALARRSLPRVALIEPGAVDLDLPFRGAGKRLIDTDLPAVKAVAEPYRDLGLAETDASSVALEEADFIVSAGNGVRNVATIEALAHTLGASIGASRVAVDDGRFTRDRQIGATGKTVSASAYIAVGISGAVQHLQGIKDCRHVIAINKDAGAPIVKRADLSIIGDSEDVMQALITRIAQARAQREMPEAT